MVRSQASVRKWAAEVAAKGRFVAPMPPDQAAANPGSLPVPCLVINNKADLRGAPLALSKRLGRRVMLVLYYSLGMKAHSLIHTCTCVLHSTLVVCCYCSECRSRSRIVI